MSGVCGFLSSLLNNRPVFSGYVAVNDEKGNELARESFTDRAAWNQCFNTYAYPNTYSLLSALLVPIRTDSLSNFVKDLLAPATQRALRVQNIALRVIAVVVALILDFITLPIRELLAIPRAIHNYIYREHRLIEWTRQHAKSGTANKLEDAIKTGALYVHSNSEVRWSPPLKTIDKSITQSRTNLLRQVYLRPTPDKTAFITACLSAFSKYSFFPSMTVISTNEPELRHGKISFTDAYPGNWRNRLVECGMWDFQVLALR